MKQTRPTPPMPEGWSPSDPFFYPKQKTDYPLIWWALLTAIVMFSIPLIVYTA